MYAVLNIKKLKTLFYKTFSYSLSRTHVNNELSKEDEVIKKEADFLLMAETFAELITALYDHCQAKEDLSNIAQKPEKQSLQLDTSNE